MNNRESARWRGARGGGPPLGAASQRRGAPTPAGAARPTNSSTGPARPSSCGRSPPPPARRWSRRRRRLGVSTVLHPPPPPPRFWFRCTPTGVVACLPGEASAAPVYPRPVLAGEAGAVGLYRPPPPPQSSTYDRPDRLNKTVYTGDWAPSTCRQGRCSGGVPPPRTCGEAGAAGVHPRPVLAGEATAVPWVPPASLWRRGRRSTLCTPAQYLPAEPGGGARFREARCGRPGTWPPPAPPPVPRLHRPPFPPPTPPYSPPPRPQPPAPPPTRPARHRPRAEPRRAGVPARAAAAPAVPDRWRRRAPGVACGEAGRAWARAAG